MGQKQEHYHKFYFDNIFLHMPRRSPRNKNRLERLHQVKPGGRLLEVGCGRGGFLELAREKYDVTGIDISRHAVSSAYGTLQGRIRQGDIETETLAAESYDAIVAFNVLEHLQRPDRVAAKLHGALCRGGVLIGSVPHKRGLLGSLATMVNNMDRSHCSIFRPARWHDIFCRAGFSKIRFFGEVTFGKSRNCYVTHRLWKQLSFNLMFICTKGD
jgi:SAM-dependent methyltransferase